MSSERRVAWNDWELGKKKLTKTTQESHRRRQQSGIIVMCTYANRAAVGTKQSPEYYIVFDNKYNIFDYVFSLFYFSQSRQHVAERASDIGATKNGKLP